MGAQTQRGAIRVTERLLLGLNDSTMRDSWTGYEGHHAMSSYAASFMIPLVSTGHEHQISEYQMNDCFQELTSDCPVLWLLEHMFD